MNKRDLINFLTMVLECTVEAEELAFRLEAFKESDPQLRLEKLNEGQVEQTPEYKKALKDRLTHTFSDMFESHEIGNIVNDVFKR